MSLLTVRNLGKAYGPQVLFDGIDFTVEDGEKVGLIGSNGSGKSTLFRIIAGIESADDGEVLVRGGTRIGYLAQEPRFEDGDTPRKVVARTMAPVREALAEYEEVSAAIGDASGERQNDLLERQSELQTKIELLGGWSWQHRVEDVLDRLGIVEEDLDRPMHVLSGGQRRRVGLARVLLEKPELMILDEPTNHLDADSIEWLESTLTDWPGAVFLVTHDRYFLERIVTRILEFDLEGIYSYPGNYEVFMERKLERMRLRKRAEAKRVKLAEQELEWLRRGPKARTTKARARVQRAEKLQEEKHQIDTRQLEMHFEAQRRLGGIVLEAAGIVVDLGERRVLDGVNLRMRRGDKVAIVGPNGCGKTTFLRALLGEVELAGGAVEWGKNTQVAYLSQTREGLDPSVTVFDSLGERENIKLGDRSLNKRTFLKEFLFSYEDQRKLVATLSGGERCRLLLARVVAENANFIILDEPTNDLDIDSLQVLEDALAAFHGCVLFVTHDRYFMNRICTAIMAFEHGTVTRWEGDYDHYKKGRDARERARREAAAAERRAESEARRARASENEDTSGPRSLTWKEERELEGIEERILEAESEKERIEARLGDPDLYKDEPEAVAELTQAREAAEKQVEALYERWQELEAIREAGG